MSESAVHEARERPLLRVIHTHPIDAQPSSTHLLLDQRRWKFFWRDFMPSILLWLLGVPIPIILLLWFIF